jgi:hypothetical protein
VDFQTRSHLSLYSKKSSLSFFLLITKMPFHEISIKHPSKSQLSKMRSGKPFRIYKGNGVRLVVDSDRLKDIGNKFLKDSGHTMKMTADEIKKNIISGNGIFGKSFDNALKKVGIKDAVYHAADAFKPLAHSAIDAGAAALSISQPELIPLAAGGASLLHSYLDKPSDFQPSQIKETAKQHVSDQVNQAISPYSNTINSLNQEFGQNLGYQQKAAMAQLNNSALNTNLSNMIGVQNATSYMSPILTQGMSGPQTLSEITSVPSVLGAINTASKTNTKVAQAIHHAKNAHHAAKHKVIGHGLYANLNGRGLFASLGNGFSHHLLSKGVRAYKGQGLHHKRHGKIYEKGTISSGGSIMNQQALSSQPYLENFISASFLPPAYAKFHTTVTV